jgi:hypothetical protein
MPPGKREANAPSGDDGYEKLHDKPAAHEDKLMVRSAALVREEDAVRRPVFDALHNPVFSGPTTKAAPHSNVPLGSPPRATTIAS